MSTFQLRPYQQHAVDAVREKWSEGVRSLLLCMPTGAGKTETALALVLAEATPTNRVLIIVERKVLCQQWVERIKRHGGGWVGIMQGENTRALSAPIIVATAQTLRRRGIPEGVGLIVIDESHIWHTAHDDVLEKCGDARVLGLTATPLREGLGLRFDDIVTATTIGELMDLGHLVRPRYYAPKASAIAAALEQVNILAGDYASKPLSEVMRTKIIIADTVGSWQKLGGNRQTIAFCVDKAHARELAEQFQLAGVTAQSITDDTPDEERAQLFADFDTCKIRILCSVGVLAVGFDSPIAACAILARPTLSLSLFIQQGGRVLRPYPGKEDCVVLDHAGNTLRHGKLEDFVPPDDLSMVDKGTDKKKRKDAPEAWVCRNCEAINPMSEDCCEECGTPRYRRSQVLVVDGELVPVDADDPHKPNAPSIEEIRDFYLQCRWYFRAMGRKEGMAFYRTQARFGLTEVQAKRIIQWHWRDLPPIPPSDEIARWLRADYQRQRIAASHRHP
jgi:superfamily II DNA or RNA helicase